MMSMFRRFNDSSLSKKLFICIAAFFVLPLLAVAIVINFVTSQFINTKVCETNLEILKQTRINIENMVKDVEYVSLTVLSDDTLQSMIKYSEESQPTDLERRQITLNASIQPLLDSRQYISSICISKGKDVVFQFGDRVREEDTSFHESASSLKGKVLWTPAYILENRTAGNSPKYVVSLIRAVNDLYVMRQLATERISIDENSLCSMYGGINKGKTGQIFVLDSKGVVISSPDKSILLKNFSREAYAPGRLKSEEGFLKTYLNKKEFVAFYYRMKETGWDVVQLVPEGEINRQITMINIIIVACIAFCILFGLFFSFIQNKSVLKPIKLMSREMKKVEKGDFDVVLSIKNRDEIGNLSISFSNMILKIKELIDSVYKSQIREREAELIAMESQINPHFLYNTLDSIRWMAVKNKDMDVAEQIEALSDLFKHVLNKGKDETTIGEEVEHLENYILIQKNRFGDRIAINIEVDSDLMDCFTLKLILQPLVENAIHHGLEGKLGGGEVLVKIMRDGDSVKFLVADNGLGTNQEKIREMLLDSEESHNVFALKNIHERIQHKYGNEFGLTFSSIEQSGTSVEVRIPLIKCEGGNLSETPNS